MATLYPLERSVFLRRLGQALRDNRLGSQLLDYLDKSGERVTVSLLAGGAAGAHALTGIKTTDRLVSVIQVPAAAAMVDLTSEFSITAADAINNAGGTDTTGDQLLVTWATRAT